jgi:hypothetical protein
MSHFRRVIAVATAFISLLLFAMPARAQDCKLMQAASLDMIPSTDGHILVSLLVSGIPRYFYVEIDAPFSSIDLNFVDQSQFDHSRLERPSMPFVLGQAIRDTAIVPSLQIGGQSGTDVRLLIVPKFNVPDKRAIGILGLDLLSGFDVELDFAKNKINLFSQNHCPGQVVYWTKNYASVPMQQSEVWQFIQRIPMQLDGQSVFVAFSTMDDHSFLPLSLARQLFNLAPGSPGLVATTEVSHGTETVYKYPFKTLEVGGVKILNPNLFIYSDDDVWKHCDNHQIKRAPFLLSCETSGDFVLTLSELRKLHLYFAYGEKKIYVTTADAH